jgi:hypothetical protein
MNCKKPDDQKEIGVVHEQIGGKEKEISDDQ